MDIPDEVRDAYAKLGIDPEKEALENALIYAAGMNLIAKRRAWKVIKWAVAILGLFALYESSYVPLLGLILIAPVSWYWLITSARRFVRTQTGMPYEAQAVAFLWYATDEAFALRVRARAQSVMEMMARGEV